LLLVGCGIFHQERLSPHHHGGDAVAALGCLLLNKSLLYRRWVVHGAKPFQRYDLAVLQSGGRRYAGEDRLIVDQHRACAALAEPAPEFRSAELEFTAQGIDDAFWSTSNSLLKNLEIVSLLVFLPWDLGGRDVVSGR